MKTADRDMILYTRIHGVNRAHKIANELHGRLRGVFQNFLGRKVRKADGTLLAKVEKELDHLHLHVYDATIFRYRSDYSLAFTVKTCEECGGTAYYYETTVYVGRLQDGVLVEWMDHARLKDDYDVSLVRANRESYAAAKDAPAAAESNLWPF